MSKKRVYFITSDFGDVHHGPAIYTKNLWDFFLNDASVEFHLIVMHSKIRHPRVHADNYDRIKRYGFYARLERLIAKTVSDIGPGLFHVNSAHLIPPSFSVRYRPLVQINDTEVCQFRFSGEIVNRYGLRRSIALFWRQMRERQVVKGARAIICNSFYTAQTISKAYNVDSAKVETLYKAVPLDPFLKITPMKSEDDSIRIIFVGNNWLRKGLDVLVDAVSMIKNGRFGHAPDVIVDVFGVPEHAVRTRFASMVESKGVDKNFNFKGQLIRENAALCFAKNNMLALPSLEEALGLVAIEAIATGIPVIGSDIGGIPEVICSNELGILVEANNANALARAILEIKKDSRDLVDFRKASSLRFTTDILKKKVDGLYNKYFTV